MVKLLIGEVLEWYAINNCFFIFLFFAFNFIFVILLTFQLLYFIYPICLLLNCLLFIILFSFHLILLRKLPLLEDTGDLADVNLWNTVSNINR